MMVGSLFQQFDLDGSEGLDKAEFIGCMKVLNIHCPVYLRPSNNFFMHLESGNYYLSQYYGNIIARELVIF